MPEIRRIARTLFLLLPISGCSEDPTGSELEFRLSTDQNEYQAEVVSQSAGLIRYGFPMQVEFHNPEDEAVFLVRCRPDSPAPSFSVEAGTPDDEVFAAYDPLKPCVGHGQHFEVPPGESRTDSLWIEGPAILVGIPPSPLGVFEGTFTLGYLVRRCQGPDHCDSGGLLPERIWSGSFEVHLAD